MIMTMSLQRSAASEPETGEGLGQPQWLWPLLGTDGPWDGEMALRGQTFVIHNGIPRSRAILSSSQAQTGETFGFKWNKRETFESPAMLEKMRAWLIERYGDVAASDWLFDGGDRPLLLDAGCGAGMSALELFGPVLHRLRYVGADVSDAVDVAAQRFAERGNEAAFVQADLMQLPFADSSVDLIFSEGVLHHTDSTRKALGSVSHLLKPGGRILFYVYRKKGPVREFTDDYIRDKLRPLGTDEAWKALQPLTRLGISLGQLGAVIEIKEPIDLLGIPAGRIDVQRLFYWHVAKTFYSPELSFEEMNHINYDWYAPANAARQTPEEVRSWCVELGLELEREVVQDAGITIIARRVGG